MTDNEIIKALECHKDETNSCQECVYNDGRGCSLRLSADALDLINRQKAKIEMLEQNLKEAHIDIKEQKAEIEELRYLKKRHRVLSR